MKRRAFTWIEALVVIAIIGILAAILFPAFSRSRENGPKNSCQSNLRQISLGFAQYVQDYHEKYPPIANSGGAFGWADVLQPYIKSTQLLQCNIESSFSENQPQKTGYTDYWFNRTLAKQNYDVKNPDTLITLGDGNDGQENTNARYNLSTLPAAWIADQSSPAYRHLEGANYAFADGHVKWLKPEKISDSPTDKTSPTFRVR